MSSGRLDIQMPGENRRPMTAAELERQAILYDAAAHYPDELSGEVAAILAADRRADAHVYADKLRLQSEARRILSVEEARASFASFEGLSLRDALLVPREEPPAIIDGLQREGHKATVVAQYKTGKTTLVGNVARSLADSVPLFDRFHVPGLAGHVAVFDYELTAADALAQYRALGIERDDRIHVESLRGTGFTLANDHHAELAVQFLRSREVGYWVLDPFGRAMRGFGSENSNDDVRGFLMRLDEIAAEAGVLGILLPVHTGRAITEVGDERARGATVLDDDPDVRWLLTRKDDTRFFRAEGRAGISVPEFALDFDPATSLLSATDFSRRDVAGQRHTPVVVAYLRAHPGAIVREIKANVSGRDGNIAAAVSRLVAEGEAVIVQIGAARKHYLAGDEPNGGAE